jgi:hypothetical protein
MAAHDGADAAIRTVGAMTVFKSRRTTMQKTITGEISMFYSRRAVRHSTKLILVAGVALSAIGAAKFAPMALSSFTIAKYSIVSGQGTSGTVKISPTSAAVQVIKFSSSNTAIASVPAGIPISPGGSQVTVPIIAGSTGGCVFITATLGTQSWPRDLIVHPASSMSMLSLTVPDQILILGGTYTGTARNGLVSGIPISLTSSDPSVLTVPASSTTVRGVASFNMVTKRDGCVTITATLRSQTVKKVVRVVDIGG